MLFWVIAAIMTAVATLALLGPVARSRSSRPDVPELHDVEVYRDQLTEVDRDLADGLVDPVQAEVARTEISRRLLAAARKGEAAINGPVEHLHACHDGSPWSISLRSGRCDRLDAAPYIRCDPFALRSRCTRFFWGKRESFRARRAAEYGQL